VDMGPKPLGKVRAKDGEEDALCAAAAAAARYEYM